jgi:hypothetical protein
MRKARSTFRITARPSHNTRLEQAPTLRQARAVGGKFAEKSQKKEINKKYDGIVYKLGF